MITAPVTTMTRTRLVADAYVGARAEAVVVGLGGFASTWQAPVNAAAVVAPVRFAAKHVHPEVPRPAPPA